MKFEFETDSSDKTSVILNIIPPGDEADRIAREIGQANATKKIGRKRRGADPVITHPEKNPMPDNRRRKTYPIH